ncbi:uncharacterized protein LOC123292140 [Chrysoperla carnea]|uniref:uncharacterized protein LOC123292140 n=1 Tax=Chrysoperla carnea TaxID=189513 RepID=UPI001D06A4AD|nr:uncharacterized protein LOC123292140 [Chrysoperla carnea]
MYNLTKSHQSNKILSSTPCWVAPNTYDVEEIRDSNESYHPFLSSKPRFETKKPFCNTFYNVKNTDKIKGGKFLKGLRFEIECKREVGPCNFDYSDRRSSSDVSSHSDSVKPQKRLPKLYVNRPKLTSGVSPPSVPTKIDEYGYDFDENGNLIKNTLSMVDICGCKEKEGTLKKSKCEPCKPCNEWRKPTKERIEEQYQVNDVPSPGAYDPVDLNKLCTMKPDYAAQQKNKKCAPIIRYTDDIYRDAYRNNYPAPCDYSPKIKPRNKIQRLVPFGISSSERRNTLFGATNLESPAPNLYVITDRVACGYQHLKCDLTFGHEERFRGIVVDNDVPPPGTYTPKVTIQDTLLSEIRRTRYLKGGFGVTSPLHPCEHPDASPAPNQYCTQEPKDTCCYSKNIPTSKFISKTKRFACNHLDTPNPFTYDTQSSFKATQDKKSFLKVKKRKKQGFLVGLPSRFHPFFGLASPFRDFNKNLGPGSYDYEDCLKSTIDGYYLPVVDRWLEPSFRKPPPGSYEITKDGNIYTDSMSRAKHSFNREVKNEISNANGKRSKSEVNSAKTSLFLNRVTKTKLLRSFNRPRLTASEIKSGVKR